MDGRRERNKDILKVDKETVKKWPISYQKNWLHSIKVVRKVTQRQARNCKMNGKYNIQRHWSSLDTIGYWS